MPKISARNLEEHRAETLERLFDAFGELLMTAGFAEISLADVAAHAGLARTAIYNYFPDRESLLFAWTDHEVRRTLEILERDLAKAETCAEKLRVFVRSQLQEFQSRHLPPGKEAMQLLRRDSYERFMHHIEPVEKMLRDVLDEGARRGEFDAIDSDSTVPMVLACIGAERVPLATRAHDVEDATEHVTEFLLRALRPPTTKSASKKSAKR